jgi:DNA-binding SARP family transcriptional activator
LSVLGPIEAQGPAGPIELTRAKERTLLATLALFHGRTASREQLVDALWGERPPRGPEKALHTHIQRVRAALGPGVIETQSGGYSLSAEVVVDAALFESEARTGDSMHMLRAALARWTGEPYADLGEWPPAEMERWRLAELHEHALERCLELEIEAGPAAGCIGELESMVLDKPLRERRWVLLATALQRDGRVADALRACQRARKEFAEELGIDPGPELLTLEEDILMADVGSKSPDDDLARIDRLRRSGNALLKTGSPAEAKEQLAYALDLAEELRVDPRVRVDLLLSLGDARRRSGDHDEAMAAYSEATWIARLHRDPVRVARAALGAAGEAWMAGLDPNAPAIALLEEALELFSDTPSPLRARLLARLAVAESMSRPFADADKHSEEALSVARLIGHPETLATALHARAVTLDLARLPQRRALLDELLELARRHTRRDWEAWALFVQARTDALYGAVDDCLSRCHQTAVIGADIADPVLVIAANRRSTLEATVRRGYEASERALSETHRAISRVIPDAGVAHAGEIAIVRILFDRHDDFAADAREGGATFAQPTVHAVAHALNAIYSAKKGDVRSAERAMSALDPESLEALPHDEYWLPFAWAYTLACSLTSDARRATDFVSILRPFSELFLVDRAFVFLGSVHHHLGLLEATAGAHDRARLHLREALIAHQRLRAPKWVQLTEAALGTLDDREAHDFRARP